MFRHSNCIHVRVPHPDHNMSKIVDGHQYITVVYAQLAYSASKSYPFDNYLCPGPTCVKCGVFLVVLHLVLVVRNPLSN